MGLKKKFGQNPAQFFFWPKIIFPVIFGEIFLKFFPKKSIFTRFWPPRSPKIAKSTGQYGALAPKETALGEIFFFVVVGPRWSEVTSGGPYNQFWTRFFFSKNVDFSPKFPLFHRFWAPRSPKIAKVEKCTGPKGICP